MDFLNVLSYPKSKSRADDGDRLNRPSESAGKLGEVEIFEGNHVRQEGLHNE